MNELVIDKFRRLVSNLLSWLHCCSSAPGAPGLHYNLDNLMVFLECGMLSEFLSLNLLRIFSLDGIGWG